MKNKCMACSKSVRQLTAIESGELLCNVCYNEATGRLPLPPTHQKKNGLTKRKITWILAILIPSFVALFFIFMTIPVKEVEDKIGSHMVTYKSRWTGKPYYRMGETSEVSVEGPVTESGKLHGEWKGINLKSGREIREWYWYGEGITEGRWHQLNQRRSD